jgi:hypothetical protein
MTDSTTTTRAVVVPDDRPPKVANSFVKWALTTPVIERWMGQSLLLLMFEGRRTHTEYVIPVSYQRDGDAVTVITKRIRKWWHNFETPLMVRLRIAGDVCEGKASIETDDARVLEFMMGYLATRPIDAKAYGLGRDEIVYDKVASIVPEIVMIRIEVEPS